MIKTITLLICLLFITTIGRSQEFNLLNTAPGENTQAKEDNWEPLELQEAMDWREKSVGLFFMPIPLNIDTIDIEGSLGSDQIGANANSTMDISINDMGKTALGKAISNGNVADISRTAAMQQQYAQQYQDAKARQQQLFGSIIGTVGTMLAPGFGVGGIFNK